MSSNLIFTTGIPEGPFIPAIGSAFGGGYFAGRVRSGNNIYALVVAPRAEGQNKNLPWKADGGADPNSYGTYRVDNGMAIMQSLIAANVIGRFSLMSWARSLRIGGFDDWYIPARDELEVLLRNLKPTATAPSVGVRTSSSSFEGARQQGENAYAYPTTGPYTATNPVQTTAELFKVGGSESLSDTVRLISSTEVRTDISVGSNDNWAQWTDTLRQGGSGGKNTSGGRAVRRVLLETI